MPAKRRTTLLICEENVKSGIALQNLLRFRALRHHDSPLETAAGTPRCLQQRARDEQFPDRNPTEPRRINAQHYRWHLYFAGRTDGCFRNAVIVHCLPDNDKQLTGGLKKIATVTVLNVMREAADLTP
ncbi:MAG: hypothetical protein ACREP4_15925 [Stenotrophomonas sp.]|uniref:hypothetical protein n=1 Tax=Stenotrophomonas sp. TaxID=69392 RepID=UPI003D6CA3B9